MHRKSEDDLFNIILENEDYKKKLLMMNTEVWNAECWYYIVQTKTKIKRWQKICRLTALTVKKGKQD